MNKLNNFDDFLFNKLFENADELQIVFSDTFRMILKSIQHSISLKLLKSEMDNDKSKFTLIDISSTLGMVSYSTSSKIADFLSNKINDIEDFDLKELTDEYKNTPLWKKYRSNIKIGKLIKKLYGDEFPDSGDPGYDIESFVTLYKSRVEQKTSEKLFDIVNGQELIYWYQIDNYGNNAYGSELGNSCMAEDCENYLNFYKLNSKKVSMLILYEDDKKEKIVARALLWKLDEINDVEVKDRIFMDRVYFIQEYQVDLFKNYAEKNNWLYKYEQTYGSDIEIVDTLTGEEDFMILTINNIKLSKYYPYLDTLQYLFQDNKILTNDDHFETNDNEENVRLISVEGNPIDTEYNSFYRRWITNYDRNYVDVIFLPETQKYDGKIRKDDAIYLHGYGEYIPKELYDDLIIETDYGINTKILKNDAIYLDYYGAWTTIKYANLNMVHSSHYKTYLSKEDAIFSKILGDYIIKEDSMKVYKDQTKTDFDFLPDEQRILSEYTYFVNGDYILKK